MAGEEVVTRFTVDASDFEKEVRGKVQPILEDYQRQVGETSRATTGLEATTGSLADKLEIARAAEKKAADAAKDHAKASDDASKSVENEGRSTAKSANIIEKAYRSIIAGAKAALNGVKQFAQGAREGWREGVKGAGGFRGVLSQVGNNLSTLGNRFRRFMTTPLFGRGGVGKGVEQFTSGLDAAGVSTGRLSSLLRGLASPLGLLVGASAGFLLNMTRLDSVQVTLDGLKRGLTGVLDQLAAGKFSIGGFFDAFAKGQEVAEQLDRINDKRQAGILLSKQEEEQVDKLLIQAKNKTLSEEERIKLLKQAQQITETGAQREIALAEEEAATAVRIFKDKITAQNKLTASTQAQVDAVTELTADQLNAIRQLESIDFLQTGFKPIEVDDEAAQAAIDATNKVRDARIAANAVIETAQNRIDFLTQQSEEKRLAAAQKTEEGRIKAAKKAAEIDELQDQLATIVIEVQDEGLKASVSEVERAVLESDQRFQESAARVEKILKQLAELGVKVEDKDKKAILDSIEAERAKAESAIRAENNAKAEKQEIDAQKRITDAILSEGDRRLQAIRDEYQQRLDDNAKFIKDEATQERNRAALLLAMDDALAKERLRQAEEASKESEKRLLDGLRILEDFVTGFIDILGERNDGEEAARAERLSNIEDDFAAQLAANEQFDQSEQNRARKRASIIAEQERQLAAERERIAQEEQAQREARSKELIGLLLDQLSKVVEIAAVEIMVNSAKQGSIFGGPVGALSGLAQGAIVAALVRALFAGLKSAIGAYEGERLVGQGESPIFQGRDGYIRRVHKNEGIIDAQTNLANLAMLDSMREGTLERFIHLNYVLPALGEEGERDVKVNYTLPKAVKREDTAPRVTNLDRLIHLRYIMPSMPDLDLNKYVKLDPVVNITRYFQGEEGHRTAESQTPMKYSDRNIVEASNRTRAEIRTTNALLTELVRNGRTRRHNRTWS